MFCYSPRKVPVVCEAHRSSNTPHRARPPCIIRGIRRDENTFPGRSKHQPAHKTIMWTCRVEFSVSECVSTAHSVTSIWSKTFISYSYTNKCSVSRCALSLKEEQKHHPGFSMQILSWGNLISIFKNLFPLLSQGNRNTPPLHVSQRKEKCLLPVQSFYKINPDCGYYQHRVPLLPACNSGFWTALIMGSQAGVHTLTEEGTPCVRHSNY